MTENLSPEPEQDTGSEEQTIAAEVALDQRQGGERDPTAENLATAPSARERSTDEATAAIGGANLSVVLDIPVQLSLELGRTRITVRDLLQLGEGSVVKLDRPPGEPLDIFVNDCLVARGEVVVVNDRFGMRITDIVSPEERLKRLR